MFAPPPAMLRAVVELALAVARAGEVDDPPTAAPPGIRPLFAFSRLPSAALGQVLRVLEDDPSFRQRVASASIEEMVGRIGWLWLNRTDGWVEELQACCATGEVSEGTRPRRGRRGGHGNGNGDDAAAAERGMVRRREAELLTLRDELAGTQKNLRALEAELQVTSSEIVRLEEERGQAIRQLKASEALLTERSTDLRRVRAELERVRSELRERDCTPVATDQATVGPSAEVPAKPAAEQIGAADLHAVGRAVAAASAAAAALADALAQTAAAFAPAVLDVPSEPVDATRSGRVRQRTATQASVRRRAPRLPVGLLDDTAEGLDHFARLAGAVVLVDGYNVSKTGWPGLDLPMQRLRLVRALVDLAARTSARVEVVFDGAEVFQQWVRSVPASIGVRFSPADVEADDVLIELIDQLPPGPVVVVSSDHRVRDGARANGAAAVASSALVALAKNPGLATGAGTSHSP